MSSKGEKIGQDDEYRKIKAVRLVEIRLSNAAGPHDARTRRIRTRSAAKRLAIEDSSDDR